VFCHSSSHSLGCVPLHSTCNVSLSLGLKLLKIVTFSSLSAVLQWGFRIVMVVDPGRRTFTGLIFNSSISCSFSERNMINTLLVFLLSVVNQGVINLTSNEIWGLIKFKKFILCPHFFTPFVLFYHLFYLSEFSFSIFVLLPSTLLFFFVYKQILRLMILY